MGTPVSTPDGETVRRLFDELVEVGPGERAERLATLDDAALRREVALLLEAHDEMDENPGEHIEALDELHALLSSSVSSSDPHQLVGQHIHQYEIEAHLGGGGMGVVYRARDTTLDRTVALKFLPPHLAASVEAKRRFIREAKAASALDHPHIATIYEIGETKNGQLFIAMAYYAGETLKAKIARGPLPIEEAVGYATQIADGLSKAHAEGIIHRDVKPANVIVTEDGYAKLLDFGLAKLGEVSLTQTGRTLGTAAYMSPEQARGNAVDHRTDVWALGVLLYEMLTGERPFQGEHPQSVIYALLNDTPMPIRKARPAVPDALAEIVHALLRKNQSERYPSAGDLSADLSSYSRRNEQSERRILFLPQKYRGLSRWIVGCLVVMCIAVAVYAAFQFYRLRQNVERLEKRAVEQFYEIKELDLQIARYEKLLEEQEDSIRIAQLRDLRSSRRQKMDQYEGYINELGTRRKPSNKEEQLIFQAAHVFNECELEIPAGFVRAIQNEIHNFWLQGPNKRRFIEAVQHANNNGYTAYIAYSMKRYNLPPQFFYLALQESNFRVDAIGPNTKWGIPKGLWQLVPSTARQYGLKVGPKTGRRVVDFKDERHDFAKSTDATGRYFRDLYATLAQASGLLVIASYNWGESRVIHNMEQLQTGTFAEIPPNPRSRSYWRFWQEYRDRIPTETHDYVVRVFAAAVIGQNPRAFGIDLDNPLKDYVQRERSKQ